MDSIELAVAIVCLGITALGFLRSQPLLLIMAGIGWIALGVMLGDAVAQAELSTALTFLGVGLALVCFVWPLTIWLKGRDRRSPADKDYEDYKRKVTDITQRRY